MDQPSWIWDLIQSSGATYERKLADFRAEEEALEKNRAFAQQRVHG